MDGRSQALARWTDAGVLSPLAPTELVFLQVTTIGAADRQVLDRVLATFRVGDLAGGISAG